MKWYVERFIFIINKRIRNELNHALSDVTLNEGNFFYLTILQEHPGLNQSELKQYVLQEQSVVTRHVNRLVKNGWLEKRKPIHDLRQSKLYLTQKAIDFLPHIEQIVQNVSDHLLNALTNEEQIELRRMLEKIVAY